MDNDGSSNVTREPNPEFTSNNYARNDRDVFSTSSERELQPVPLPVESCIYKGEGNANIVIALPHEKKIIRFRKLLCCQIHTDPGAGRAEGQKAFIRYVASCFLGTTYVLNPEILRYNVKDVAKLSETIRSLRPEKRRHKDIAEEYAMKFPDYTTLPSTLLQHQISPCGTSTFCVEIKPKQGFIRKTERRLQKCPYCLTQYYKLRKKTIASRSPYCPLDLFSGDEDRMKIALKGLLRSPQNNLKIFKDGIVVYDQDSTPNDLERILAEWFRNAASRDKENLGNAFCTLVRETLLRSFPQDAQDSNSHPVQTPRLSVNQDLERQSHIVSDTVAKARKLLYFTREECNFEGNELPPDSVLGRIFRMQRLCGSNTDSIYDIYSKYATFLKDDLIYADLKSVRCYTTSVHTNDDTKDRCTSVKNISFPKEECHDDPNGNKTAKSTDVEWSVQNNEIIENTHVAPNISTANEHCHVSAFKGRNCNERENNVEEADALISIENLVALRNYLLFTTARDCSVLMAFQEIKPDAISTVPQEHAIQVSENVHFLANVRVSDVDPKSVHCIRKHMQRDTDVLESVISTLEEELAVENSAL